MATSLPYPAIPIVLAKSRRGERERSDAMRISEERAEYPSSVRSQFEIVRGCDAGAQNEIAGAARTFYFGRVTRHPEVAQFYNENKILVLERISD
jgi:hypothetical protein